MLKSILFFTAAVGYGVLINVSKPILSRLLGDSGTGNFVQMILVITPIFALIHFSRRALESRHGRSQLKKSEISANRNALLWLGRLSLTQAYWCGYVPYAVVSAVLGNYVASKINKLCLGDTLWAVAALIFIIALLALSIVGVWRSGERYGGKRLWVALSRITMTLGAISICLSFLFNI